MVTFVEAAAKTRRTAGVIPLHGRKALPACARPATDRSLALDLLPEQVEAGVPTATLDKNAHEFALDHGAVPATKFYKGYRHALCTSLNHVVCHGIPTSGRCARATFSTST